MRHFIAVVVIGLIILLGGFAVKILFKGLPPELASSRFIPSSTVDSPECEEIEPQSIEISKSNNKTLLYNSKFSFEVPAEWEVTSYRKGGVVLFNSKKQSIGTLVIVNVKSSCYEETKKYLGNFNSKEAIDGYYEEKGNKYLGFDITKIDLKGKISYEKGGIYYRGNSLDLTTNEFTEPLRLNTIMALSKDSAFAFTEVARGVDISIDETNALFSLIQIK